MSQFFINLDIEREERYDFAKFLDYQDQTLDPLTSKFLTELRKLPVSDQLAVGALENRIDLISNRIYGETQLWWVLMEYNDLQDPENIPAATMINYPSILDLELLYFNLNSDRISKGE